MARSRNRTRNWPGLIVLGLLSAGMAVNDWWLLRHHQFDFGHNLPYGWTLALLALAVLVWHHPNRQEN